MAGALEIVSKSVSADEPCGPDLEQLEDRDYWLVLGRVEPQLPTSLEEYEKFADRNLAIAAEIAATAKLLERSHDLKLLTLLARLYILGQDLDGFIETVEAIHFLVTDRWESFHPQGDVEYRVSLVERLEFMPDTGYPLRDCPLFASPRLGKISYRMRLLATGALSNRRLSDPESGDGRDPEKAPGEHEISGAAKAAKAEDIVAARDKLLSLVSLVEGLETNVNEKAGSQVLRLPVIKDLASNILDFLNYCLSEKDPSLAPPPGPLPGLMNEDGALAGAAHSAPIAGIGSARSAEAHLQAVEDYFARHEPSSPARLYVAQARALVGKTFAEAIETLVPNYADQAFLPIGGPLRVRLPVARLAALLPPSSFPDGEEDRQYDEVASEGADDPQPSDISEEDEQPEVEGDGERDSYPQRNQIPDRPVRPPQVLTRHDAVQHLEAVSSFFRHKEPSSAIPLLLGEARTFVSRDFVGALRTVLPSDAFAVDE